MRVLRLFLPLLLACGITTGCAAIASRQQDGAGRPFAGVRDNVHAFCHPAEADVPSIQFLNIVDAPFSAVVDVLALPFDLSASKDQPVQSTDSARQ